MFSSTVIRRVIISNSNNNQRIISIKKKYNNNNNVRFLSSLMSSLSTETTTSTLTITTTKPTLNDIYSSRRNYVSRAHPKPIKEYEIIDAVDIILNDIKKRKEIKKEKWDKYEEERRKKNLGDKELKLQDETIELVLNLNLDPKLPGQSLRGSLNLPNGSGKKLNVIVFTKDKALADKAIKDGGALYAGSDDIIDKIKNGTIPLSDFQRSIATKDIINDLKGLARMLGPRGLYPNKKDGTIIEQMPSKDEMENIVITLLKETTKGGSVPYRTEKFGNVLLGIGKESFGKEKILENIMATMKEIYNVKPENIGKKKKGGSGSNQQGRGKKKTGGKTKYFIKASLSSTQGIGIRIDLRTIDPTSTYFMTKLPTD